MDCLSYEKDHNYFTAILSPFESDTMFKKIVLYSIKIVFSILIVLFIISVGLFLRTKGEYSVAKTVAQDSSIPHIVLDGVTFHCETFGDSTKQPLLVLHGGPGSDFRYLLPLSTLADSFFVIFYDQRGTGLSPRVSVSEQTLENSLDDVKRFVDRFSPERPIHIVGHSWGAMLATGFTSRHPGRVGRIVLAEPGLLTSEMGEKFREKFSIKPSFALMKEVVMAYFESLHIKKIDGHERKDYIFQRISGADLPDNPMTRYFCDGDPSTASLDYWRSSMDASIAIQKGAIKDGKFSIDLLNGFENYSDTVLFITSSCNSLIGTEYQQEHMTLFPKLRHEEIANAGHTMFGEQPAECNKLVREFLGSYDNDSSADK